MLRCIALHPTPRTLTPEPYTLHPAPYTLHSNSESSTLKADGCTSSSSLTSNLLKSDQLLTTHRSPSTGGLQGLRIMRRLTRWAIVLCDAYHRRCVSSPTSRRRSTPWASRARKRRSRSSSRLLGPSPPPGKPVEKCAAVPRRARI